jgi:hypothetical protein
MQAPPASPAAQTVVAPLPKVSAPPRKAVTPRVKLQSAPRIPAALLALTAQQKKLAMIGAGVVLLLVVIVGVFVFKPAGSVTTGTVLVDAVPYAVVAGIENTAGGERPALPAEASTPLRLNLPAGTYRVQLTGPPPASESRVITVTVNEGAVTTAPPETFKALTAEEYFEPYLTAGSAPSSDASATDSAAPSDTAPASAPANNPPRVSEGPQ